MKISFNHPIIKMVTRQAERILGNRTRLILLIAQIGKKIASTRDHGNATRELRIKILTLGRLLKAHVNGSYRAASWKSLIAVVAAVIYFINPADIIPDIIPMTGLVDDLSVILWTYHSIQAEIDRFIEWEKSRLLRR